MQYEMNHFKGLRTRDNEISQLDGAIDCDNVHLDVNRRLKKIDAFKELDTYALGPVDSFITSYYIERLDELFVVTTLSFFVVRNATSQSPTWSQIGYHVNRGLDYKLVETISFAEIGKNLYIADTSGYNHVQKYDGKYMTRSGAPKPIIIDQNPAGTTYYDRIFIGLKDANGVETMSDYAEAQLNRDATLPRIKFDLRPFQAVNDEDRQLLGGYLPESHLYGPIDNSFTALFTEHNLIIGDILYVNCRCNWDRTLANPGVLLEKKITVTNVSAMHVTFAIEQDDINVVDQICVYGAISNCRVYAATSQYETYDFNMALGPTVNPDVNLMYYRDDKANSVRFTLVDSILLNFEKLPLDDIYDTTIVKGDTPKMKYITSFNDQLVGVIGDFQVAWSDLGVGSSCETFAPFDTQLFNNSKEGIITAVFGGSSFVSVFKSNDTYHMVGALGSRSYRIAKDDMSGIGCVAHKSVIPWGPGCLFMSSKGIYSNNGMAIQELTNHIEPTMLAISNKAACTALVHYDAEKVFFIFDDFALEFDYYNNEWFKHTLYNTDYDYWFGDGTMYRVEKDITDVYTMSNLVISVQDPSLVKSHQAYYQTPYIVFDKAYVEKLFNYLILMSVTGVDFEVELQQYWNWVTGDSEDSDTKSFDSTTFIRKFGIKQKRANSMSFKITSTAGEDMILNGAMIEYQPYQGEVRAS